MFSLRSVVLVAGLVAAGVVGQASAQNDWQYPDPYFGAIEIQKSRSPAADARNRREISPPAKPRSHQPRPRLFRGRQRGVPYSGEAARVTGR
jgi:hypothetical protein